VDGNKLSVEEAVALVETGFGEVLPFVQTVVSAVSDGNSWDNVLRRYLSGESIRIRVGISADAGVFATLPVPISATKRSGANLRFRIRGGEGLSPRPSS
jgi:hypothetical protein